MSQNSTAPLYLFLLRESADAPDPTPDQMQQAMQKWMAWIDAMKAKGIYLGGDRLEDGPARVIRSSRPQTDSDGPFVEAKELVGGYMVVSAPNIEAASTLARDCPGLQNGWTVEVRQLYPRRS